MKNITKIIKLSKAQHKWIALAFLLITIQAIQQQITPITLKFVVDELSAQISTGAGVYNRLVFLFLVILGVNLGGTLISTLNQRLGDYIASRLGKHLTEVYYRKIFTLPQKYFDNEVSGKIVNQLSRGINSIKDFVGSSINFIMPALLQSILGIGVLMYFDIGIGLLALAVFPIYIAISSYSTKRWGALQAEKNIHEDIARGRIQEVVSNIKLVKTYNTQRREWELVSNEYKTLNKLYDKQSTQYHLLNFLREFGVELAFILILFIVIRNTFNGIFTLGEMILTMQILNQLRWPLFGMSFILEQVQAAEADSKAFFEVLSLPESEEYHSKPLKPVVDTPQIAMDNLSFAYDDGDSRSILDGLNLKLESNQTVALVGHSGAGKTTLINIILKLYDPTSGKIMISGKDYAKEDHSWIRSHIALVFQDNELFSSTVRENVAYGADDATDQMVIDALKQANAWEFVERLPDGLDAKIGERGVKLSGGQKQRIQIARAILHDKPILILDEATSSLDSRSENLVQEALENLFKNRLVIIIAHRFSTIQNADRIVVIDQGKIVDEGNPHELAQRDGIYSELLKHQIDGNKKLLSRYEIH